MRKGHKKCLQRAVCLLLALCLCSAAVPVTMAGAVEANESLLLYLTYADVQVTEQGVPDVDKGCMISNQQLPETEADFVSDDGHARDKGLLYLAQNEKEGFQVFFRETQAENRKLRVVVSDFTNTSGEKLDYTVYQERFFGIEHDEANDGAQYFFKNEGTKAAEALLTYDGGLIEAEKNYNKMFYIELDSAKDQTPGDYHGKVTFVNEDGTEIAHKDVTATVWNFTMPEGRYCEAVGEVDARYQDFLLNYGITPTFYKDSIINTTDLKQVELDLSDPRRQVVDIESAMGHPDWVTESRLANYLALAKNPYLKDKFFFFMDDEITWNADGTSKNPKSAEGIQSYLNNLSKVWPGAHTTVSLTSPDFEGAMIGLKDTDILFVNTCLMNFYGFGGNWLGVTEKSSMRVWNEFQNDKWSRKWIYPYYGQGWTGGTGFALSDMAEWSNGKCLGMTPSWCAGIWRRLLGWQAYDIGATGIYQWHFTNPSASIDYQKVWSTGMLPEAIPNGDAMLLYPGELAGYDENTPIPTLRFMQFVEGLDDYDYLKMADEFLPDGFAKDVFAKHISGSVNDASPSKIFNGWNPDTSCQNYARARYLLGKALSDADTGHSWGDWDVAVEPDATHNGMEIRTCKDCGTQESREIPKTSNGKYLFYLTYADAQPTDTMSGVPAEGADSSIAWEQLPATAADVGKRNDASDRDSGLMYLAQNEREGFQIFYRELEKTRNLRVEVGTFKNSSGETLDCTLYNEGFLSADWHTYEKAGDVLFPYGGEAVSTQVGYNKAFYAELRSTENQTPGNYTAQVTLYDGNTVLGKKTVTATVWNFALPEAHYSEVSLEFWEDPILKICGLEEADGTIKEENKSKAEALVENYQAYFLDHSVSPMYVESDLVDKDPKELELTLADPRRTTTAIPSNYRVDWGTVKQLQAWKNIVYDNPYLRDKVYFYIFDEPGWKAGDTDENYKNFTANLEAFWPGYHMVLPFTSTADYDTAVTLLKGTADIFCPEMNLLDCYSASDADRRKILKDMQSDDWDRVWTYQYDGTMGGLDLYLPCGSNNKQSPGIYRRVLFWEQYEMGTDGFLHWNCMSPNHDYQKIWETRNLPADGNDVLLYPGNMFGMDPTEPVASIRFKQLCEGMDDYDYMMLADEFLEEGTVDAEAKTVLYGAGNDNMTDMFRWFEDRTCQNMAASRVRIGNALSQANTQHSWGDWGVAVTPDGGHNGLEIRTCKDCGTQESREIPATGEMTVRYDANGGSGAPEAQTKIKDQTLTLSTVVPTRSGYTFMGWATAKDVAAQYRQGGSYTDNRDVTLYAVWQQAAQTLANGTYYVYSALDQGYAWDIGWVAMGNGGNLELCGVNGQDNQKFLLTYQGDGYYQMKAVHSDKALDVTGAATTAGANVQQYAWNASNAQLWYLKDAGDGYFYVFSKCSGLCVSAATETPVQELNIQMEELSGSNAKRWRFVSTNSKYTVSYDACGGSGAPGSQEVSTGQTVTLSAAKPTWDNYTFLGWATSKGGAVQYQPGASLTVTANTTLYAVWQNGGLIPNGTYTVCSAVNNGYVWDITGGVSYGKTNLEIWPLHGGANQQFVFTYLGDGYYKILTAESGMAIEVSGSNVQQNTWTGADNQKWQIQAEGDGYYYLRSKSNGGIIDLANASAAYGTNIQTWNENHTGAQKWKLTQVSTSKSALVLRGAWAGETEKTLATKGDTASYAVADGSSAAYGFKNDCVSVDKSGQVTVLRSGICEVAVTKSDSTVNQVVVIPGDCDKNGVVNTADCTVVMELASGDREAFGEYAQMLADLNGDGKVNTADVTVVMDLAVGDAEIG